MTLTVPQAVHALVAEPWRHTIGRAVMRTFDPRVHKGLLRTYDGVGTFSGEIRPDQESASGWSS